MNRLLNTVALVPFLFAPIGLATSCRAPYPAQDPNPAVVEEHAKRTAELDAAYSALELARATYAANPTVETRAALDAAQADYDAKEAAFVEWERNYTREKWGPVASFFATTLGTLHPALQAVALPGAAFATNIAAGLATRRGRKHAAKAVKHFTPWKNADGTPFKPVEAAADLARMLGWKHSSEATELVADGKVFITANPDAEVAGPTPDNASTPT